MPDPNKYQRKEELIQLYLEENITENESNELNDYIKKDKKIVKKILYEYEFDQQIKGFLTNEHDKPAYQYYLNRHRKYIFSLFAAGISVFILITALFINAYFNIKPTNKAFYALKSELKNHRSRLESKNLKKLIKYVAYLELQKTEPDQSFIISLNYLQNSDNPYQYLLKNGMSETINRKIEFTRKENSQITSLFKYSSIALLKNILGENKTTDNLINQTSKILNKKMEELQINRSEMDASELCDIGLQFMAIGEINNAEKIFNIINENESNSDIKEKALYCLGECARKNGKTDQAVEYYSKMSKMEQLASFELAEANLNIVYNDIINKKDMSIQESKNNPGDYLKTYTIQNNNISDVSPTPTIKIGKIIIKIDFESELNDINNYKNAIRSKKAAFQGNYGVIIKSNGFVSQEISAILKPNITYEISARIKTVQPGSSWGNAILASGEYSGLSTKKYGSVDSLNNSEAGWQDLSYTLIYTPEDLQGKVFIGVRNFGMNGLTYIDNICLKLIDDK